MLLGLQGPDQTRRSLSPVVSKWACPNPSQFPFCAFAMPPTASKIAPGQGKNWFEKASCWLWRVGGWRKPNWRNCALCFRKVHGFSVYRSGPHLSFCLKKGFYSWRKKPQTNQLLNSMISGLFQSSVSTASTSEGPGRIHGEEEVSWILCGKL